MRSGERVIVLLCGGDKRTQSADIERALAIAKDWAQPPETAARAPKSKGRGKRD